MRSGNGQGSLARRLGLIALIAATGVGVAFAQQVPAVTGNARVDKLISEMTLAEKISMLNGSPEDPAAYQGQAGFLAGVPRLGIPSLRLSDGPPGVLTRVPAMAPTATMGLAATFSKADARANGEVIAREAKARGIDVVLEPFINIDRDVTFRRGYNTLGEDPLLTGEMGAAEIQGIQNLGVMSQAKHYIAFDSTFATYRSAYSVDVSPQALHEIYLPPFADAVRAGVSSIMCSYNLVNGRYACGNPYTLKRVLRGQLGFKGFVTSDWGATHSTLFINDGLDVEMPGTMEQAWSKRPAYFARGPNGNPIGLEKAVQAGLVSEKTIDRAVGRVLIEMDRFGLLDGKQKHTITPPPIQENAKVVLKTGEDAAVLLKNDGHALPLDKEALSSLALIGPGAGQTVAVGQPGEKAVGLPQLEIGPYEVLKKDLANDPSAHIRYAVADDRTGVPIPADAFSHDGSPGLQRTSGGNGIDHQINFTKLNGNPLSESRSYAWKGVLTVPSSGEYRLHMEILGAYGTLRLDGKTIAHNGKMYVHGDITQAGESDVLPTTDGLDNPHRKLFLSAGAHELALSVSPDTSGNPIQIRLSWVTPEQYQANYRKAIEAAKNAKTAIVFVWAQGDPHFQLPGDQNKLVEDVSAVNPNTIVVLNLSQPVALPWLNRVKAVLNMWWPGDEGGQATANILLGRVSPAGRLPFTWGEKLTDYPATDPAHPERLGTNRDSHGSFTEGILVGYRWFDAKGIEPLFPFGYGLTYSRFAYSGLRVVQQKDGGLDVKFQVENTGTVASDAVPQVYLGAPSPEPEDAQFAPRALCAFERIHLDPGQSQIVDLHIPARSLEYWSTTQARWVRADGERVVYAGKSSRDLPLHASISIR